MSKVPKLNLSVLAELTSFIDATVKLSLAHAASWWERNPVRPVEHRVLLVNRMGSVGSTWFAKALNAHPDVYCYHEGALSRVFPSFSTLPTDLETYLQEISFNSMHGAYSLIADVGSLGIAYVATAPEKHYESAVLLRHPLRVLSTRLQKLSAGNHNPGSLHDIFGGFANILGVRISSLGYVDSWFLNDVISLCVTYRSLTLFKHVVRIEECSALEGAVEVFERITGLHDWGIYLQKLVGVLINRSHDSEEPLPRLLVGLNDFQLMLYDDLVLPLARDVGY